MGAGTRPGAPRCSRLLRCTLPTFALLQNLARPRARRLVFASDAFKLRIRPPAGQHTAAQAAAQAAAAAGQGHADWLDALALASKHGYNELLDKCCAFMQAQVGGRGGAAALLCRALLAECWADGGLGTAPLHSALHPALTLSSCRGRPTPPARAAVHAGGRARAGLLCGGPAAAGGAAPEGHVSRDERLGHGGQGAVRGGALGWVGGWVGGTAGWAAAATAAGGRHAVGLPSRTCCRLLPLLSHPLPGRHHTAPQMSAKLAGVDKQLAVLDAQAGKLEKQVQPPGPPAFCALRCNLAWASPKGVLLRARGRRLSMLATRPAPPLAFHLCSAPPLRRQRAGCAKLLCTAKLVWTRRRTLFETPPRSSPAAPCSTSGSAPTTPSCWPPSTAWWASATAAG